ncbi:MAG: GNAT family N-acetyltransferase [Chloroflexota bacterium]
MRRPEELEWFLNGHPRHPELGLWATITNRTVYRRLRVTVRTLMTNSRLRSLRDRQTVLGKGLGTEAAQGVLDYGFNTLHLPRLVSLIDSENIASIRVAEHIGMHFERSGEDEMGPFQLYSISNPSG